MCGETSPGSPRSRRRAAELFLPGGLQKGRKRDAYLDLSPETARQLRRYRSSAWKTTEAVFPSRQSDRMSKTSVRRLVKKATQEANVRPFVAGEGRGDPEDVTPHTFRHSIAFRMIRREDKRLEDVMLRLRHSSIQTISQIYDHLRRQYGTKEEDFLIFVSLQATPLNP